MQHARQPPETVCGSSRMDFVVGRDIPLHHGTFPANSGSSWIIVFRSENDSRLLLLGTTAGLPTPNDFISLTLRGLVESLNPLAEPDQNDLSFVFGDMMLLQFFFHSFERITRQAESSYIMVRIPYHQFDLRERSDTRFIMVTGNKGRTYKHPGWKRSPLSRAIGLFRSL